MSRSLYHKNNQISFQDKGHFELEFEIKVENFDGSLTAEANPEIKVELLRFIMDDNQTAQAVQRQVLTKSRVITTSKPPIYITGMQYLRLTSKVISLSIVRN